MSTPQDEPIDLAALKAHDPVAQKAFWASHWGRVNAACARILGPGADAADVATDVIQDFLFKYVDSVNHQRAVRSYLRLMATRRSLRRRGKRDRHDELHEDGFQGASTAAHESAANQAMLMPKLGECMAHLTPKAQQVLKLRFSGELTNQRIGELVGGSKQYIGKLLRQSMEKLRSCIEKPREA